MQPTTPATTSTASRTGPASDPAARRRSPSLVLAARRAVAVLSLGLAAAGVVGCSSGSGNVFDPRTMEANDKAGPRPDPDPKLQQYPAQFEETPVPRNAGVSGRRVIDREYLAKNVPTTGQGYAEKDVVRLSLREVITRAVLNSSEVKVAGYDPAINSERVKEQIADFDPALFMNLQTSRQDQGLSVNPINSGSGSIGNQVVGFTDKIITNTGTIGVRQKLITGGEARLSWGLTWNRIDNINGGDDKFWQNEIALSVTQPLLRNYGRDVNSARIEIARGDERISILDFRKTLEDQLSELERAYWQLHQSVRVVDIQELLLIDTIETYRVLYERWKNGLDASQIPVSQAQSSVKARQADLIRAKQSVRDLSSEIKRRMNDPQFPVSGSYVILTSDNPLVDPIDFDRSALIDAAFANRFELGQQLIRIDQARIAEIVAVNNKLPRFDLVLTGGVRGLGTNGTEAIRYGSDFNSPFWQIGVEIEYPPGNRAAEAIFQRARLQRLQAIEQYRNLLAQVALDVEVALNDIRSNWEQMIARKQAREASRTQLDLLQKQQDLGEAITPSFVQIKLQAQEELALNAREEVAALAGYNIAIQRLERAKGTLLRYNNVQVKEDPGTSYQRRAWVEAAR